MKSSARNQFSGTIIRLEDSGGVCMVSVLCDGEIPIQAQLNQHSRHALKLAVGMAVVVMIKAAHIVVVTDLAPLRLSAENSLHGTVSHVEQGAVNNVVTLALPQGPSLSATITLYSSERLALEAGQPATAVFNASQVMLGVLA